MRECRRGIDNEPVLRVLGCGGDAKAIRIAETKQSNSLGLWGVARLKPSPRTHLVTNGSPDRGTGNDLYNATQYIATCRFGNVIRQSRVKCPALLAMVEKGVFHVRPSFESTTYVK